ncbi:MAG: hypothetical protein AVDCRST_MAG50-1217, partial [uncultured Acidimicrobiales bacterium]
DYEHGNHHHPAGHLVRGAHAQPERGHRVLRRALRLDLHRRGRRGLLRHPSDRRPSHRRRRGQHRWPVARSCDPLRPGARRRRRLHPGRRPGRQGAHRAERDADRRPVRLPGRPRRKCLRRVVPARRGV